MKKYIIIVLVLLVVFVGYWFFYSRIYVYGSSFKNADTMSSVAIEQQNPLLCGQIKILPPPPFPFYWGPSQQTFRAQCYFEVAQQLKKGEICDYINSSPMEIDYKYSCIIKVAIATKNVSLCDKLPTNTSYSRDNCIYSVNK